MVDVPEVVRYGRVKAHLVAFYADSGDAGEVPDEVPLSGTVTLTPRVEHMRWPTASPPRTAILQTLKCPLWLGWLYPPGTEEDTLPVDSGVVVAATDQPDALPDKVQWTATFALEGVRVQPSSLTFEVPANGVVDLTTVLPASPEPGTVIVVSTEDRERAEAAAEQAELAADRAENASMGDIDYDLILGRVEPLVDDAVDVGLSGVGDLVASALVPYATTSALTQGLATKQPVGNYALVSQLPDTSGLATKSALASGLAGKQDAGDYATKADLPDLGDYATTAYVDQTVGDIDAALSGILGGE